MADRISERFSTNVRPRGGNGFPFAQAQIRSWLRRAHVIESKIFCIARARVPTDRLRPQPSENERLSSQRDSKTSGVYVRLRDLAVPRMGRSNAGKTGSMFDCGSESPRTSAGCLERNSTTKPYSPTRIDCALWCSLARG